MHNDKLKFKKEFQLRLIKYSIRVIRLCSGLRHDPDYWTLADQLIRSATSIGANVAEARSSSSKREYVKYFEIALKSTNETIYWLILLCALNVESRDQTRNLLVETREIGNILASGILTMKGKR